jgi:prepilin-type N-terminal cleavage/methylation domain-containing protein
MTRRSRGLTLIELLLVVAILAATAGMVVSMTDKMASQACYDDTARRLTEIRSATLGPDAVSADGSLLAGGFLQDAGCLPGDADLLRPPEPLKAWMMSNGTKELYQYDPIWKIWYGWRGPYLAAPPRRRIDVESCLYDGWGNKFVWPSPLPDVASPSPCPFPVQSLGADGKPGGTGFAADYPETSQPLIADTDWRSPELSDRLRVTIVNLLPDAFNKDVRLRLIVPNFTSAGGPLSFNPDVDNDRCVSQTFLLAVKGVPATGEPPEQNQSGQTFRGNKNTLKVPLGRRMLFLLNADGTPLTDAGGRPVDAFAELPLSRRLSPSRATLYIRPRG